MPGGGCGLRRPGEGRKPTALRSFPPCGCSLRRSGYPAANLGSPDRVAGPLLMSLRTWLVAISSSQPPMIAKSIGPSLKRPRAVLSCATQRTIRPCATSFSLPSCSGASCRLRFRRRARVPRWPSGCGARSMPNCRRIWDRGSTNLGQLRREVLQAMPAGAERKALLHELAHREVCQAPDCPARAFAASGLKREVPQ